MVQLQVSFINFLKKEKVTSYKLQVQVITHAFETTTSPYWHFQVFFPAFERSKLSNKNLLCLILLQNCIKNDKIYISLPLPFHKLAFLKYQDSLG